MDVPLSRDATLIAYFHTFTVAQQDAFLELARGMSGHPPQIEEPAGVVLPFRRKEA